MPVSRSCTIDARRSNTQGRMKAIALLTAALSLSLAGAANAQILGERRSSRVPLYRPLLQAS